MLFTGRILIALINFFTLAIVIRIILSWFNPPYSKWLNYLYKLTDPILNFFKKTFPLQIGFLDLSPIVPLFLLGILNKIISDLMLFNKTANILYFIELTLFIAYFIFSFIIYGLFIGAILLLVVNIIAPTTYNPMITMLRSIIDPMALRLRKILKLQHRHADKIYLGLIAALIAIAGSIGSWLLTSFLPSLFYSLK